MNNIITNKFIRFFMIFLYPFSFAWEYIYKIRRFFYSYGIFSRNDFQVPIISVGNLTFGGTGKTPFTLWLAKYFHEEAKKVMILSRGYKGKLEHGTGILKSDRKLGYNPFDYGDEALMLARRLENASIVVGKRRSENLEFYFDQEKPDVVILDDGHQHLKLARNLNIILFDSLMPLASYKVAPLGYMREGFSALQDADAVVFGRTDQVEPVKIEELKKMLKPYLRRGVPFAEVYHRPVGFISGTNGEKLDFLEAANKNVICVAGIASPKAFFLTIESLGCNIVETLSFPDHHYFTVTEATKILDLAKKHNAYVITTEKDMVKLKRVINDDRIYYLEIEVDFLSGKKEIMELIKKAARI